MALSVDETRKIAALARLELSAAEEELYTEQLQAIVGYIDQLGDYETAEEPRNRPAAREAQDVAREAQFQQRFMENAPALLDSFLLVPQVKA